MDNNNNLPKRQIFEEIIYVDKKRTRRIDKYVAFHMLHSYFFRKLVKIGRV